MKPTVALKLSFFTLAATFGAAVGCIDDSAPVTAPPENITAAVDPSGYPEAVLIEADRADIGGTARVMGTLIAPDVVLTFDVMGPPVFSNWKVMAPFAGNVQVPVSQLAMHSWSNPMDWPTEWMQGQPYIFHSVALLRLASPIDLPQYPDIALAQLDDATEVVRISNNDQDAWVALEDQLSHDGSAPTDYVTSKALDAGYYGGGPVMVKGSHQLVALNYGWSDGQAAWPLLESGFPEPPHQFDYVVRVDTVAQWIEETMAVWSCREQCDQSHAAGADDYLAYRDCVSCNTCFDICNPSVATSCPPGTPDGSFSVQSGDCESCLSCAVERDEDSAGQTSGACAAQYGAHAASAEAVALHACYQSCAGSSCPLP